MARTAPAFLVACALLAISAVPSRSAPPTHEWSLRFGSTSPDRGLSVAVDAIGNSYVTGFFAGAVDFGGGPLTSAGSSDIFVAKYNANGVHQWSKRFGSTDLDEGHGIALDANGHVLVTGFFIGTVDFGGGPLVAAGSGQELFIAKYDMDGNHVWSQRFGDNFADVGMSIAVDTSDNVAVAGYFTGSINLGGSNLTSAGTDDVFLAKYDADGNHLWSQRMGGSGSDQPRAVAVDALDNILLTGEYSFAVNFGGGALPSAGAYEAFVAKYDASGAHLWSRGFASASTDVGNGITADSAGNVLVTGQFFGTVDFGGGGLTSAGAEDAFVAKYDASGAHLWSQRFGGVPDNDRGYAIAVNEFDDVIVTGSFQGSADFGGGPFVASFRDIFLAKYDADGLHQWSAFYGLTGADEGRSLAVDSMGNVLLTGHFQSTADFGGGGLTSAGGEDVFLVKYSDDASSAVPDPTAALGTAARNYPNPFAFSTTIEYTIMSRTQVTIEIVDASGARVARLDDGVREAGTYAVAWDGRDGGGHPVAAGVYYYGFMHGREGRAHKMSRLR